MERKRLLYGMVGGGPGAFIGKVHRAALALDGRAVLACGAFSSDPAKTRSLGRELGLPGDRLYDSWEAMAASEAARPDGIDFVVIVTPNHLHHPIARAFLSEGFHVACDKPLAVSSAQADELARLAAAKDRKFCVTYTYTGYPAVKQARRMAAEGAIGEVRFVQAEYLQDAFALPAERQGNKQAEWRFDPARAGSAATLGDIGTHVENIVSYVAALRPRRVSARLSTLAPGRTMDDNGVVMAEYPGGAQGLYWVCQALPGAGNALRFRLVGSVGSLEWSQEDPARLRYCRLGEPERILVSGRDVFHPEAEAFRRLPAGHPEGFIEALANVYAPFLSTLAKIKSGTEPGGVDLDYPGAEEGAWGLRFVEACAASSRADSAWTDV